MSKLTYEEATIPQLNLSRRTFWMMLSECQKDIFIAFGLTVLCALTRLYAIPASLWEWDDVNFARALHRYDIAAHSPHPPGFPVFVAMGKLAYALLGDEHQALVAVNLVFAVLFGAILFYLYREFFDDRRIAFAAALLSCFAPSLWVHSTIARSDVSTLGLGLIALLLVLRGRHSRLALLAGCGVLGLGIGMRVTVLPLVGPTLALVLLMHVREKQWRLVLVSLITVAVFILCWYVPMIMHTTWDVYQQAVNSQSQYVWETDTIFSPHDMLRPRLNSFFVRIWGADWIAQSMYLLGAIGAIMLWKKHRRALGWMMLAFVPFIVFTLIINTPMGAVVYSMPYIPFFTGLAACGLVIPFRRISWQKIWPLANPGLMLITILVFVLAIWSLPLINILRSEASPPVRAVRDLRERLDPTHDRLYYDALFPPHVNFYLSDFKTQLLQSSHSEESNLINPAVADGRSYALTSSPLLGLPNTHFHWPAGKGVRRLHTLSIGRYFDVYVTDVTDAQRVNFLSGWHQQEEFDGRSWRWMKQSGHIALLAVAEQMVLHLRGQMADIPGELEPATMVLRLDGKEIARFTATTNEVNYTTLVPADLTRLWSVLTIETSRAVVPRQIGKGNDDRELGFQCLAFEWKPAPGAASVKRSADQFLGEGWYSLERDHRAPWRWTSERAIAHLPSLDYDAQLDITLLSSIQYPVDIEIDGKILDRVQPPKQNGILTYQVPASLHRGKPIDLILSTRTQVIPTDSRALGLCVSYIGWTPVEITH